MPKEFGRWSEQGTHAQVEQPRASGADAPPDLMRSVAELEEDLYQRVMRNLYPVDIPRGQDYHQAVMRILAFKELPEHYAMSPVWQHARHLYAQIEALKKKPGALLWNPV